MDNNPGGDSSGTGEDTGSHRNRSGQVPPGEQSEIATRDDVVLVVTDEGVIESTSGDIGSLLGVDDPVGEPFERLLDGSDAEAPTIAELSPEEFRETILSVDSKTEFEVTLSTDDGPVSVVLSTVPLPDQSRTVCVLEPTNREPGRDRDTKRPQQEDNTRKPPHEDASRRPHQTEDVVLVETIDDPVFVIDDDWRITRVNDAMVEYTGYDRDELVGRNVGEIVPSKSYDRFTEQVRDCAEIGDRESETVELRLVTRKGSVVLSEANATVLINEDGSFDRAVSVLRDVSERKRREDDLELLLQVLTRVFRHNFRNQLNTVQGRAELLADELDGSQRVHTDSIVDTTQQLIDHSEKARLIEDVIDTDEILELDLVTVVESSLDVINRSYPDVSIDVDLPESATVTAHPRIGKAITELFDNAIQHAPPDRPPRIRTWLRTRGVWVTLFVEDESGGLGEHEIEVLKQGSENELKHSSGLGLWLVRWLVKHSDANLIAQRTERGSLMGIRFRRSERAAPTSFSGESPLTEAHVPVDQDPERVHGETVVGRGAELHQLENRYDSLDYAGGHAVFVTGVAGAGKSTLIDQFLGRLVEHSSPPLIGRGRCENRITPSYDAFDQVFEELPVRTDLAELIDEIAAVSGDDAETMQQRRQTLFAAVADELRVLATDQPVVLVLEDLHWADRGTIALLEHLIDEVGQWALPILFVGTVRTGEVDGTGRLDPILETAGASNRVTQLELDLLDRSDVRNLLQYMLNVDCVTPGFLDAVYERTGGNPLFVNEVGRELAYRLGPEPEPESLPTDFEDYSLPETVETAMVDRIADLDPPERELLQLGAIVGDTAAVDVLIAASDREEEAVHDCIDRLVEQRLWDRSDGQITFVYGLVHKQALETIDSERRSELHARIADAIETVHADRLERNYGQLGTQYEHAGNLERAMEYYRAAGDHATETYAYQVAVENLERALTLATENGLLDEEERATLQADIAEALWSIGELNSAGDRARAGLDLAPDGSVIRCRLLDIQADVHIDQGNYDRAATTTAEQQELAVENDLQGLQASAVNRLGLLARRQGDYDEANDHYEAALDLARASGNSAIESKALKGLGAVEHHLGTYDSALEYAMESIDIVREIGDRRGEAETLNFLGAVLSSQGKYDEARERYAESLEIHNELSNRHAMARTLNNLGLVERREGAYDQARSRYERSLEIARELDDRKGEAYSLHNLGEVALFQGAHSQARDRLQESLDIARVLGDTRVEIANLVLLGTVETASGEYRRARRSYDQGLELARDMGHPRWAANSLQGLGDLMRHRGEYDDAADSLEEALRTHEEIGNRSGIGETRIELGRLELARGNIEAAREQAQRARTCFEELDATHWVGRSRLLSGRIEAETGTPTTARDHYEAALEHFERIDAPQDELETLEQLVRTDTFSEDERRGWLQQARRVLDGAPRSVNERHAEWIEDARETLDPELAE